MRYLYKPASFLASMLFVIGAWSQTTFTNQGALLQSIPGSSWEDCAADMNNDNLDDIVRVTSSRIYIDYQNPDGSFTPADFAIALENVPSWSIVAADFDDNGFTDLLIGDGNAVSFVMASDDGTTFTEDAFPEYIFSQRTTAQDIDLDGHLDAFVCHDVDQNHAYHNDGSGNMTLDISLAETMDVGGNYAAIWVDYDDDGDSDLYLTKCRGGAPFGDARRTNLMYRNDGDTFTEVGAETGMDDHNNSWATVFEDFDNDGDFDAFTVNHSTSDMPEPLGASNVFMTNNGDGTFTNTIMSTGIDAYDLNAWNCDAGDFDNNGYVDIFSEMSMEFWFNNGDGTFTSMNNPSFDSGGIGDFNNDGFLDVINGNSMYINDGNDNNYVTFYLEGIVSNKDAIGSKVEIYGDWGVQVREVRAGESFSPFSSLLVHFGLGTWQEIDEVVVRWPSGLITSYDDLDINQNHHLIEAECLLDESEIAYDGELNLCPGQTLTLEAPAGFDTYTWSNGADSQMLEVSEPGNYSVVGWQGDCASIAPAVEVVVITDETPSIEIVGDGVVCEGDEIILTATDAAAYYWSNSDDTQTIAVTESGDYFVSIDATCSADQIASNTISVTFLEAAEPTVSDMEIGAPGSVDIMATGTNLSWYDSETSTTAIGTGDTFTTPVVNDTYSVWVESVTTYGNEEQDGGAVVPDYMLNGGLPSTGAYSMFNAWEPFTIETVEVNVPVGAGAGVRTVQLVDQNNVVLAEETFDLAEGTHTLTLNFDVPEGEGLSLRCPENNMFRSFGGLTYPYAIGTVGEIYDSFYGTNYYYYFYDWSIRTQGWDCVSDRVEVTVNVVSVEEIEELNAFNAYPNPATEQLNVELELTQQSDVIVSLMDVTGRTVYTTQKDMNGANRITLPVNQYQAGIYTLAVQINGQQVVKKIIVE